jgi:hypothetical protein
MFRVPTVELGVPAAYAHTRHLGYDDILLGP